MESEPDKLDPPLWAADKSGADPEIQILSINDANSSDARDVYSAWGLTVAIGFCLLTVFFLVGAILSASSGQFREFEEFIIGYGYASTFAVILTTVIWSTLGPGKYRYRFGFAVLWNFLVMISTFSALSVDNGPPPEVGQMLVMFVLFLMGAWLLPQAPLWMFRFWGRVGFDIPGRAHDGKVNQFGILQLLIVTGLVALFLGGARAAISLTDLSFPPNAEPFLGFGFLILCAAFTSVPLWIAALMERYVFGAILIVLALVAVASYWQHTLLGLLVDMRGGPSASFFIWQSVVMSFWSLFFASVMRWNGYRFVRRAR